MSITGIGETVLDIVFRGGQPQAAVPGGSTFNAMISLGRTLGRKHPGVALRMVTQTGDDPVADIVTAFMKENRGASTCSTRTSSPSKVKSYFRWWQVSIHRSVRRKTFSFTQAPLARARVTMPLPMTLSAYQPFIATVTPFFSPSWI